MRATQISKRNALTIAVAWARESSQRWANVANSLGREGYERKQTEAALLVQASELMRHALEVELMRVQRTITRNDARLVQLSAENRGRSGAAVQSRKRRKAEQDAR